MYGCTIGNVTLLGIRATILDGVEIGEYSIVAARSLIREGKSFPKGLLITGNPAQVKRDLTEEEKNKNLRYASNYVEYSKIYLNRDNFKTINY